MPEAPPSGVGKDPRPKFEDQSWTPEEKEKLAKMRRARQPEQLEGPGIGRVKKAKALWDCAGEIAETPQVRELEKVIGLGSGRVKNAKDFWDNPEEKAKTTESPLPKEVDGCGSRRVRYSKGFWDANQFNLPKHDAHNFPEIENNALEGRNTGGEGENAPTEGEVIRSDRYTKCGAVATTPISTRRKTPENQI